MQQRLQHIVDSYGLTGSEERGNFERQLVALAKTFPAAWLEWALVEVLVQSWLRYPLPRGQVFLEQVWQRLVHWQTTSVITLTLTPEQFEQVTGLPPLSLQDPLPAPQPASSDLARDRCPGVSPDAARQSDLNSLRGEPPDCSAPPAPPTP